MRGHPSTPEEGRDREEEEEVEGEAGRIYRKKGEKRRIGRWI